MSFSGRQTHISFRTKPLGLGKVHNEAAQEQCDQMLKLKVAQIYPKVDQKSSHSCVHFLVMSF